MSSEVRRYFSISQNEYDIMYREQDGKCSICKSDLTLSSSDVDHDHEYNQIRGLLCRRCNLAIGMFHDDSDLLREAANYIDQWRDVHEQEIID